MRPSGVDENLSLRGKNDLNPKFRFDFILFESDKSPFKGIQ